MRTVTRGDSTWRVVEPHVGGYQFWDDWENAAWEQYTLDVVSEFARPGTTVLDLGSWIGPISLWASDSGADVIAVEPDPLALRYLGINVRRNHANVAIIPAAIAPTTGTTHITAHADGWASSMTQVTDAGTEVPCLTLPDLFDLCDIENCSLVKADLEGYECQVLEHIAPFLAELGIPLLVAMHQPWWTRPVSPDWFSGFGKVEGEFCNWGSVLALPK